MREQNRAQRSRTFQWTCRRPKVRSPESTKRTCSGRKSKAGRPPGPAGGEPSSPGEERRGRGAWSCDQVQSEPHWDVPGPARSPTGSGLFLDRACRPAPRQSLKKGRALASGSARCRCRGDAPLTCHGLWGRVELSVRHRTGTQQRSSRCLFHDGQMPCKTNHAGKTRHPLPVTHLR